MTIKGDLAEARIILPPFDNDGASLYHVNELTLRALVRAFGGATSFGNARGEWEGRAGTQSEAVQVIDVAMAPTTANRETLERIAAQYRIDAAQECVYVRHASGDVVFVGPGRVWEIDAADAVRRRAALNGPHTITEE